MNKLNNKNVSILNMSLYKIYVSKPVFNVISSQNVNRKYTFTDTSVHVTKKTTYVYMFLFLTYR